MRESVSLLRLATTTELALPPGRQRLAATHTKGAGSINVRESVLLTRLAADVALDDTHHVQGRARAIAMVIDQRELRVRQI